MSAKRFYKKSKIQGIHFPDYKEVRLKEKELFELMEEYNRVSEEKEFTSEEMDKILSNEVLGYEKLDVYNKAALRIGFRACIKTLKNEPGNTNS